MRQIQPHRLWVGHAGDSRDFRALFGAGIEAVVQLAVDEPTVATPRELVSCRFPLLDGIGNPSSAIPARCNSIASRIKRSTSSFVRPVATHPGRSGT